MRAIGTLFLSTALVASAALALPSALQAQSTCVCTADFLGLYGGAPPRNLVRPEWATCACPDLRLDMEDRLRQIRNTQQLRRSLSRTWSLPEEMYARYQRERQMERRHRAAELRAASRPPRPTDPVEAALAELRGDGRTAAGTYRMRVEGGSLVLRGEVPTVFAHQNALALAADSSGLPVRDELRVTSLGALSDEAVERQVGAVLTDNGVSPEAVTVQGGVVSSTGSLPAGVRVQLLQLPGVRAVR